MSRVLLKACGGLALVAALGACVTPPNLAREGNGLPPTLLPVVTALTAKGRMNCIKITGYDHVPKNQWQQVRPLNTPEWTVVRFYTSNGAWFKASVLTQGFFDDVYYNPATGQLICGDHGWSQFGGASGVLFQDAMAKRP